jgi:N-acetylmuramoyl-L-alanine amidase
MAMKVFIGVGHGGSDPGAVANGFRESDLNLAIALACQDELARHGVLTKISRTKDENDSLSEEIKECNAFDPDIAVEIHNNAGGGDGIEVFYSIYGGTGKVLAENILSEAVKIGQNSRGAKTLKNSSGGDYYGWIRNTKAPAVIVECAFVDNKTDIQIIDTKAEQVAFGVAIAKGVLKTLGVAYKAQEPAVKEETTGKVYRVQVGAYSQKANAEAMAKKLKAAGYDAIIV